MITEYSHIKQSIFYFCHAVSANTAQLTAHALQYSPLFLLKKKICGNYSQIFQTDQYLSLCLRDLILDWESTGWLPWAIAGTSQCCYFIFEFVLYGKLSSLSTVIAQHTPECLLRCNDVLSNSNTLSAKLLCYSSYTRTITGVLWWTRSHHLLCHLQKNMLAYDSNFFQCN